MSWNNLGPIAELAPGQSIIWEYSWQYGADKGVQLAGPNYPTSIISPDSLATLVASNQGKQLNGNEGNGAQVNYVVTITNTSSFEIGYHNLQGGGVS